MSETVKNSPLAIKTVYGALVGVWLILYYQGSASLGFKFLLSFSGILGYIILLFHSAFQKRSIILFVAPLIFCFLLFFNVAFLAASIVEKDLFVFTRDEIPDILPLIYTLGFSLLFYLVINAVKGWNTGGEKRLTKIFIGFLVSFILVEKIISLSLSSFSNIILGISLLIIFSELVTISVQSFYPQDAQ